MKLKSATLIRELAEILCMILLSTPLSMDKKIKLWLFQMFSCFSRPNQDICLPINDTGCNYKRRIQSICTDQILTLTLYDSRSLLFNGFCSRKKIFL